MVDRDGGMSADEPAHPTDDALPAAGQSAGHGAILLSREQGGPRDLFRRYVVLIDDHEVGRIGRGQTLRFDVPPGVHRLQMKIDWLTSAALTAVVEAGRTVSFMCCPGGRASQALSAAITNKDGYITLWQTPEPIVMVSRAPLDRWTRVMLGAALGFFGGGSIFVGAWMWRHTGVAPEAATIVFDASLAVTLASMIVLGFLRRHHKGPWRSER